ncbi:MAG: gliding motility-associated C-terminal domain-containing protein [Bacteroidota bacterium]
MHKFFRVNILLVLFVLVCFKTTKAQLVINELSQGTGVREYVEFLVVGTPDCTNDCVDLRNWIFDDNNGTFATGGGTGIVPGCFRFNNVAFWSCIKIGTIILVYDGANKNTSITLADDVSKTDGNCKLIIPVSNTTLFTGTQNSAATYPPSFTTNTTSVWSQALSMGNDNDSFQTRDPNNTYELHHSVNWGNNTNNSILFFSTTGAQVRSMENLVDDDIFNIANWTDEAVTTIGSETPGSPNNAANAAWINSLSNNCTSITGTAVNSVTIFANPNSTYCDGQEIDLLSTISPTSATVTYEWFQNNVTTGTIVNSLTINATSTPTTYSLKVTDLCSNTITSNNLVIVSSGPITSITINYTPVCTGNATTLTSTVTPSNMSNLIYSWQKNGVASAISSTLVTTITSTTTTYTLSVIDACGNSVNDTKLLFETPPNPNFLPSGSAICKTGTSLVLTATSSGGTWSVSPATTAFNSATGTFNYSTLALGTYTVTYQFTSPCAASSSQTYSFKEIPIATISSATGPFCLGNTIRLTANSALANNGTYTYLWQPTNSSASFIDVTNTSTHSVTVTNSCGSTTSNVSSLLFITNPPNFSPNGSVLCETDNVITFTTVTSGGNFTITPSTSAFDATAKTFNPLNADKNIEYTISYSFGGNCPATEVKTFTVEPNATANITISKEGPYCNSENITLTSSSEINNLWSTGATTNSIIVNTSGVYSLSVKGCGTSKTSDEVEIIFNDILADFTPSVVTGNTPLEVAFTNLSSENSISYFWNFGDSITSELENPTHIYIARGEYLVSLIAKNDVGCVDTAFYKFIKVTENNYIYIPNSFTPNNDGKNELFFPKTSTLLSYRCLIFNRWGELVFESSDINQAWDGLNATDAVYVYKMKVTFSDNTIEEFTGTVTLLH